jgi:HD-GYP domain-containing protein (c-di-GMP phosphodiesterase class II)
MKSDMRARNKQKKDRENNVLLQFSLFMLAIVALVSVFLAIALSSFVQDHVIRMHAEFYADGLAPSFRSAVIGGKSEVLQLLKTELADAGRLPHVKDLAIWSSSGDAMLRGTEEALAHENWDAVSIALRGSVHFVYGPGVGLSLLDRFHGDLTLYMPITDADGGIVGVLGLLESDEGLSEDLGKAARAIALYVASAGIAIYLTLFFLYFRSYRKQRMTNERLRQSQDSIIFAMSSLSSLRDQETGGHLLRCSAYVRLLASRLRVEKAFRSYIDAEYIRTIASVAPLHDIGKVGIADAILRKPGKLTDEEYEAMKEHSVLGADILRAARARLPFHSQLELAIELTRHHHERWDGKGYPDGLAGEAIPLSARLMALADVYDALRSERYYKAAMPHNEAIKLIGDGAGSQFDPRIVEVLVDNHESFSAIFDDEPRA